MNDNLKPLSKLDNLNLVVAYVEAQEALKKIEAEMSKRGITEHGEWCLKPV